MKYHLNCSHCKTIIPNREEVFYWTYHESKLFEFCSNECCESFCDQFRDEAVNRWADMIPTYDGFLFYDIDGVLNSGIRHEQEPPWYHNPPDVRIFRGGDWVENHMVDMLEAWSVQHNVGLVGMSSWFTCRDDDGVMVGKFMGFSNHCGVSPNTGGIRDIGALEWMDLNAPSKPHVLLDDAPQLFRHKHRLVKTSGRYGLNWDNLNDCSIMLGLTS